MAQREDRRRWPCSPRRGLVFSLAVGLAILAICYVIISYRLVARGAWQRALLDLGLGSVIVGVSIPIAVSAWRAAGWSRAFRYFVVWTVGVGSVVATLSVVFLDLQSASGGAAVWVAICAGGVSLLFYLVGDCVSLVARLRRAIRADRDRRSQKTPGDTSA